MTKSKWLILSLLIVTVVVAAGLGIAGCAKNSGSGQNSGTPSVTTENGQAAGNSGPQQMQTAMKKALAGLVDKGTITQAQADKVLQAFTSNKQGQGQGGGQGQGQGGQGQGALAQFVADGTLTQAQANAIQQALPQPSGGPGGPGGPGQTKQQ